MISTSEFQRVKARLLQTFKRPRATAGALPGAEEGAAGTSDAEATATDAGRTRHNPDGTGIESEPAEKPAPPVLKAARILPSLPNPSRVWRKNLRAPWQRCQGAFFVLCNANC